MPRYDAHLYVIVRIPLRGIEADSPEAAASKALDTDVHDLLDRCFAGTDYEYAEGFDPNGAVLVDSVDPVDPDRDGSRCFTLAEVNAWDEAHVAAGLV